MGDEGMLNASDAVARLFKLNLPLLHLPIVLR